MARGKVQACGGGVSFRYEQGAVLGSVLCRNGEIAARRFATLQKELVRPVSGLVRQDALQAHQRAGSIQHRQQQLYNALTFPLPDATKSRDTFPLQVRVCIRCTSRSFPDGPGQLGRRGPARGLFFFGSFPGSGDAFPQGLALGRGQVFGRSGRPRSFITGDPVPPPAAGRIIQVDTVGPVLAAGLVRGAATVQHAVCLDVFHQQPGSPQALFKGAQDVTIHGRPLPVRDPTAGAGRAHAAARQGGRRAPRRRWGKGEGELPAGDGDLVQEQVEAEGKAHIAFIRGQATGILKKHVAHDIAQEIGKVGSVFKGAVGGDVPQAPGDAGRAGAIVTHGAPPADPDHGPAAAGPGPCRFPGLWLPPARDPGRQVHRPEHLPADRPHCPAGTGVP